MALARVRFYGFYTPKARSATARRRRRPGGRDMDGLSIRDASSSDRPHLRAAIIELHEHERSLHDSRLPGEEAADAYLEWMLGEAAERGGAVLLAEVEGAMAGFAAGWIVEEDILEETPDSNRFGYVSDVCVLQSFRGRHIAAKLIEALEQLLCESGVMRIRLSTLAANAPARSAYERAGYTPYEIVYEKVIGQRR
jgi:ribosomal protein S18 acetylase RimI-like enzyme